MQADLVLYNGDVHTMDTAMPRAQAVARIFFQRLEK